jgi:hypothetical protein
MSAYLGSLATRAAYEAVLAHAKSNIELTIANYDGRPDNVPLAVLERDNILSFLLHLVGSSGGAVVGGGTGGAQESTLAAIQALIGSTSDAAGTASLIGLLRQLSNTRGVLSHAAGSVSTSITGTNWVQLPNGEASSVTLRNRSGTDVEISIGGSGQALQIPDSTDLLVAAIANSNEWSVRRVDQSNTPVTVEFYQVKEGGSAGPPGNLPAAPTTVLTQVSANGTNAIASVTLPAAPSGQRHIIQTVTASYSAAPTGGGLTIAGGPLIPVTQPGVTFLSDLGIAGPIAGSITASLAPGGGGVIGVIVVGYKTEAA